MKKLFILSLISISMSSFAQSVIGNTNSGAVSNNNFAFSVGEIFVLPTDADKTNSGTLGILNQFQLTVTGINNKLFTEDVRFFPNPVSTALFLKINGEKSIEQLSIYDLNGRLLSTLKVNANSADLSFLTDGVYLVKTNLENVAPFKIIKQ